VKSRVPELPELAFRTADAKDANAAIAEVREAEGHGQPVRSYELIWPDDANEEWLLKSALPRLVYHLESLRARPPSFAGVVLSIFTGARLHFVRAADFLPAAGRLVSLTVEQMYAQFGTGEQRTPVDNAAPLLLPPGKNN
jgi:hypothetical protein